MINYSVVDAGCAPGPTEKFEMALCYSQDQVEIYSLKTCEKSRDTVPINRLSIPEKFCEKQILTQTDSHSQRVFLFSLPIAINIILV